MGIRCKSGTIPVAVILAQRRLCSVFKICNATVCLGKMGRRLKTGKSQKTCHIHYSSLRIRVKRWRGITCFLFIISHTGLACTVVNSLKNQWMKKTLYTGKRFAFQSGMSTLVLCFFFSAGFAQHDDSTVKRLEKVIVTDIKNPNTFTGRIPVQSLNQQTLRLLNAPSVGDAARYFSGALIKDYGGVGGLKTISVRSLGASSTGIMYDGIPVSDAQTGQIDLSRFSSTFVQNLSLTQGSPANMPVPARSFAYSSVLAIATNTFQPVNFSKTQWRSELAAGSFGLWQPSAGIYLPLNKNTVLSANAEGQFSKGNYPYQIKNGPYTENRRRTNSAVNSWQGEMNLVRQFKDSAIWQTKFRGYFSDRELPGSIIFFNPRSVQQLWNRDYYLQSRYQKTFHQKTSLLLLAKYSHSYTRYTDADFQNGIGGLDSRYNQQEYYLSGAVSHQIIKNLEAALATDASYATLTANQQNFAEPVRTSLWNSFSLQYREKLWQASGSILNTFFSDKARVGVAANNLNKLTHGVSFSIKPGEESPLLLRAFYKETFRMPTFNDLYYNFIGNRNLRPEHNVQYNVGITFSKTYDKKLRRISLSADGYLNQIRDKIVAVPNQNLFNWSMFNMGRVQIKGLDINGESNAVFSSTLNLFLRLAYTWQNALDITDRELSTYKNKIPYTPDHSGSALLILGIRDWSAGYSMLFSGKRFAQRSNGPTNLLPAWFTHDISLNREIKFTKFRSAIKAELNNITDSRFDVVRYFPMPGRNFKISISFYNL